MERTARGLKLPHAGDEATAASWRWERGLGLSLSVRRAAQQLPRCRAVAPPGGRAQRARTPLSAPSASRRVSSSAT